MSPRKSNNLKMFLLIDVLNNRAIISLVLTNSVHTYYKNLALEW